MATIKDKQLIFESVFRNGEPELLEWLQRYQKYPTIGSAQFREGLTLACEEGQLSLLTWALENGEQLFEDIKNTKPLYINLGVLYTLQLKYPAGVALTAAAALGGHLDILQWLLRNCAKMDHSALISAALTGQQHVLKFLLSHEEFSELPLTAVSLCAAAAIHGRQRETLQYLCNRYGPHRVLNDDALCAACAIGAISFVQYILSVSPIPLSAAHYLAPDVAYGGSVEVAEYLRSRNFASQYAKTECTHAAKRGHLEFLKWLHAQGNGWATYPRVAADAADYGQVAVLEWFYFTASPSAQIDSIIFQYAAQRKQSIVFDWAVEKIKGDRSAEFLSRISGSLLPYACSLGRYDILKLFQEKNLPINSDVTFTVAAERGDLETLRWAKEVIGVKHNWAVYAHHHVTVTMRKSLTVAPEVIEFLRVEKEAFQLENNRIIAETRKKAEEARAAAKAKAEEDEKQQKEEAMRRRRESEALIRRIMEREKEKKKQNPQPPEEEEKEAEDDENEEEDAEENAIEEEDDSLFI